MRLLIAGGGTGGHIYPALAVVRSLRAQARTAELAWVGGHRGLEEEIVREAQIPFHRLVLRSLRSVDRSVSTIVDPLRLAVSVPQAATLLARLRPAAVFTTGGYVAIPVVLAARPLGIPVILWEGNVVPGRSVQVSAGQATAVAVSFEATCAALGLRGPCYVTGTPIRDLGHIDRLAAREPFGVPSGDRLVLIFGGSQAVRRFNRAVGEALPELLEQVQVIHVTGNDGYPEALRARAALPPGVRDRYHPYPFLRDEMPYALAAADLVVGRAGSSTLAEVAVLGLPLVVVPYPHAAGHQDANARVFADAGAARLIPDAELTGATLLDAVSITQDAAVHARMSAAARSLARPRAADAIASLVIAAADRAPLPEAASIDRLSREAAA